MKKIIFSLLAATLYLSTYAQEVTVSGDCVASPVTLTLFEEQIDGKNGYTGTGTVAGYPDVGISIFWDKVENAWMLAYDGQPFFESKADTQVPPGTASTAFSWEALGPSACDNPLALSITGDVVLWVRFGAITAVYKNNQLRVNWESLKEQNNDHFEIEGSKDGEHFTHIATVASKAKGGNSDTTLQYEWTAGNETGYLFGTALLIGLIAVCGSRKRRNLLLPVSMIVLLISIGWGCRKNGDDLGLKGDYYIRIVQVDKDGTTNHSKVIKVTAE